MKLIVGLGNPDKKYTHTRHNLGFDLLDYIGKNIGFEFTKEKFNAKYTEIEINGEKNIIIKPLSYMNLSGEVVKQFVSYYKINYDDILVIQDDLDLTLGKIKLVYNRNNGGHNGIRNIEENLATKEFLRVKIGIKNSANIDAISYVLGCFNSDEMTVLEEAFFTLKDIIKDFNTFSRDKLMNKYNSLSNTNKGE